jgi:hypothetical protein
VAGPAFTSRLLAVAVAALVAVLAPAAPALAQTADPGTQPGTTAVQVDGVEPPDDGTVGPGQVITEPAEEVQPAAGGDDASGPEDVPLAADGDAVDPSPDPPKRGELHVLGTGASSSNPAPVAAASTSAPRAAASAGPATLPFTGVNAGLLALAGATLLAAGLLVRRSALA